MRVLIFRARASLHEFTEATELECSSVRTALSAAADGEAGRLARTRRAAALSALQALPRVQPLDRIPAGGDRRADPAGGSASLGRAAGRRGGSSGVAGAKVAAAKVAVGAALAAATIGVSAGGVAVWSSMHPHHPPQRGADGGDQLRLQRPPARAGTTGSERSLSETAAGDDDGRHPGGCGVARQDTASSDHRSIWGDRGRRALDPADHPVAPRGRHAMPAAPITSTELRRNAAPPEHEPGTRTPVPRGRQLDAAPDGTRSSSRDDGNAVFRLCEDRQSRPAPASHSPCHRRSRPCR